MSLGVPAEHALIVSAILFVIGLAGVMARRNVLFILMSLEVMMNAAAFAFVVAGNMHGSPDGQIMFIFVLTVAAAEAAIGLAIVLQFYHRFKSLDVNHASKLKG
ncbi:NADH-quinone oxidoreductase subunit NuoK [Moraxella sp. Pampa]|uniref:NADH-quinone oxidoreductase subunit NuoK n=1 Tax=Moraxella sp. Pampa TaxID=3111978 RepID=UPI003A5CF2C6